MEQSEARTPNITRRDFLAEIAQVIEENLPHRAITQEWLVYEMVRRHCDFWGEDDDYGLLHSWVSVPQLVRAALRLRRAGEREFDAPVQSEMKARGYKHLHDAYSIKRKVRKRGKTIWVQTLDKLDRMSLAEVDAKIAEYKRIRIGLDAHIDELERYRNERAARPNSGLA